MYKGLLRRSYAYVHTSPSAEAVSSWSRICCWMIVSRENSVSGWHEPTGARFLRTTSMLTSPGAE
eukprot:1849918-Pyramimonas_sp.AAC.1